MSDNQPFVAAVRNVEGLAVDLDGCPLIQKSVALRPDDLSIEFAGALVAISEIDGEGLSPRFVEQAGRARAGADRDALLTRNLDRIS
jgi:hypothetical protein